MEELNKVLPAEKITSEKLEDIMSDISEMGINIISDSEQEDEQDEEFDYNAGDEDNLDEIGNIDTKEVGHSDDPVRMYLKEMGLVELLSREGEIAISKRIEAGKTVMISGLCESPMTLKAISEWRDELVNGTMQLRDIVDLEMMYGDDSEAMVFDDENDAGNMDDLEKVTKELNEKNLDDIDDDLEQDIDIEGDVESDIDEESDNGDMETLDGENDEMSANSEDEDEMDGSGRNSTSITAMETVLMQPVLDTLNKISG